MIETALVFALGALTTAILAVVVMPAFTRRAARLARRDLEARLPRTLDEIAALRDGVRAEYAARTARVQVALDAANQSLVQERLTKAEMAVQLSALRSERRAYQATMAEAEERITAAFADLRDREESLARAEMEKRELDRQLVRMSERFAESEGRSIEAERWASGVFTSSLATVPSQSLVAPTPSLAPAATVAAQPVVAVVAFEAAPTEVSETVQGFVDVASAGVPEAEAAADVAVPDDLVLAGAEEAVQTDVVPPEPAAAEVAKPAADEPKPALTVATLPPAVAAAIAARLKAARDRPMGPSAGTGLEPSVALPQAAPWSVPLSSPEIEEAVEAPAPAKPPVGRPRRGRPVIARVAKPPEPSPGSDPRPEPPLWNADPAPFLQPMSQPKPRPRPTPMAPTGAVAAPASAANFLPRPIPVVRRPAGEEAQDVRSVDEEVPPPRDDVAVDSITSLSDRAAEFFDPIANLPPRVSDPIAFPPMAAPAASRDTELPEEERSRRVDSLAERLRVLRRRGAGGTDEESPPAKSNSS